MIMLYINACKIDMFNSIDLDQSAPQFSLILTCNIFLVFRFCRLSLYSERFVFRLIIEN